MTETLELCDFGRGFDVQSFHEPQDGTVDVGKDQEGTVKKPSKNIKAAF